MAECTVDGRAFLNALTSVLPHASNDPEAADLCRIDIQVADTVMISATNRFTAALSYAPVLNPDGEIWEIALRPSDAKEILRLFKPGKDGEVTIRIAQASDGTGGESRAEFADVSGMFADEGRQFTVPDIGSEDERGTLVHRLIAGMLTKGSHDLGRPSFAAGLLALFDAAGRAHLDTLVWTPTGQNAAVLITCGERFLGLLMPVRLFDESVTEADELLDAWAARLPETAQQAVA